MYACHGGPNLHLPLIATYNNNTMPPKARRSTWRTEVNACQDDLLRKLGTGPFCSFFPGRIPIYLSIYPSTYLSIYLSVYICYIYICIYYIHTLTNLGH